MNIPTKGAIIKTNYKTGPYIVVSVSHHDKGYSFRCYAIDDPLGRKGEYYLNNYRIIDGRLLGCQHSRGSAGWAANGGGRDGDGYNEIIVLEEALQMALFV